MNRITGTLALVALLLSACDGNTPTEPDGPIEPSVAPDLTFRGHDDKPGFVVTLSNSSAGNEALVFPRAGDGTLGAPTSYATGGTGTDGGLGNQGAAVTDGEGRMLYVVNAGSNTITAFRIHNGALFNAQVIASGGEQPISIAVHRNLLYVLNDGGTANLAGFRIRPNGTLVPLPGEPTPLSTAAPDAAQVSFGLLGRSLIVTEKATNNILVFPVHLGGRLGQPSINPSNGATPFGFAVDRLGRVIVSEAFGGAPDASALSSYRIGREGLSTISASVGTTESAACWVLISPDGRFAYTTNTASGTVSGYKIDWRGRLQLLDADGVTATTAAGPIDMAQSRGFGRFLYVLGRGTISAFARSADGSLSPVATTAGLPDRSNGLVAF